MNDAAPVRHVKGQFYEQARDLLDAARPRLTALDVPGLPAGYLAEYVERNESEIIDLIEEAIERETFLPIDCPYCTRVAEHLDLTKDLAWIGFPSLVDGRFRAADARAGNFKILKAELRACERRLEKAEGRK